MNEKQPLYLSNFKPISQLVVPESTIREPRFPVIDAHNHLGETFGGGWDKRPLTELLDVLDVAKVQVYVDLDGGWGEEVLHHHLDYFKSPVPERFLVFGGVDWSAWPDRGDGFGEWAASRLSEQVRWGAQGLKIWKPFGLRVQDHHGKVVAVDDTRLDAVWETAGELNIPVMIHVADPVAFFRPLNASNERWEELHAHPDWHFPSPPYPAFETIINGLANLVLAHPRTTFIGAHVGCYAENLGWVSQLLDKTDNFYVDISARIGELGRQPYTARKFFLQYADRILFGTDIGANLDAYRLYYRFLESEDEHFNYNLGEIPRQGRWYIYGLYLPDDVLQKIYHLNARRILRLG